MRYNLHASRVSRFFCCRYGRVFRRLADGTLKELSVVDGGRLLTRHEGEALQAADIAWCLHYGNWPKYRLAQLDGDPFNCAIENLRPIRTRALRFRAVPRDGLFFHKYSEQGFATEAECRSDWVIHARAEYDKDLPYVLEMEAKERALAGPVVAEEPPAPVVRRVARAPATGRVKMPPREAGREWHWWAGAWRSVPVACHPADDYMVRLEKCARGAVRFSFVPDYQEVWAFDAAGQVVQ